MVLCLPCGSGAGLVALRSLGVPAVGLDVDPHAVEHCRSLGLVAFAGEWTALNAYRHRFDGAWVDPGRVPQGEHEALWAGLGECLLPGARLLLEHPLPVWPAGFEVVGRQNNRAILRAPRPPDRRAPGLRVGPYGDLFVGCRRVVEMGAGSGRFLDALRLREIECIGIEQDPALVELGRSRGQHMLQGGLEALAGLEGEIDGLFLGHSVEALSGPELEALFQCCRQRLARHGRLVVRAERSRLDGPICAAVDPAKWKAVHRGCAPLEGRDAFLLLLAGEPLLAGAPGREVLLSGAGLELELPPRSPFDLERFERRQWSQGGEDGVLEALFDLLGTTNRTYVELGCGDGVQCNTAALRRRGWTGLAVDGIEAPGAPDALIVQAWITAENVCALLDSQGVPEEPDLLSIDLDGNDYWVWKAITRKPRVLIVEYNANLPADRALTIPYDPAHRWNGTDYYGASFLALARLGKSKGYTPVYCTQAGVNAFFVREDLAIGEPALPPELLYRPPNYWYRGARSYPDLSRRMVSV